MVLNGYKKRVEGCMEKKEIKDGKHLGKMKEKRGKKRWIYCNSIIYFVEEGVDPDETIPIS